MRQLTRRQFLGGEIKALPSSVRPPWALGEAAFVQHCTRCGACIEACPTAIIVCGTGGYPVVNFSRGECTFCGECVSTCRDGALQRTEGSVPWRLNAEIGNGCLTLRQVECRVCGEQCGPGAIRFRLHAGRVAAPSLDPGLCSGCGACVATCPAQAVVMSEPLTAAALP